MAMPAIPSITGGAATANGGTSSNGGFSSDTGGLTLIKGDPWITAAIVAAMVFMVWRFTAK